MFRGHDLYLVGDNKWVLDTTDGSIYKVKRNKKGEIIEEKENCRLEIVGNRIKVRFIDKEGIPALILRMSKDAIQKGCNTRGIRVV